MRDLPIVVSLPITDRRTSFAFYRAGLGLQPLGEPAADGLPEPLRFRLDDRVELMLVPRGGFGWVIGDRDVARDGTCECVLGITAPTNEAVDRIVAEAHGAGARVVSAPTLEPWGYAATFADPDGHLWMVASG